MIDLLTLPFMQRALIAGAIMAIVMGYLGVFVVLRRMAFFGSGIAHASLAGVAAGLLLGWYPFYTAIIASLIFSLIIFYIEKTEKIASDTIISMIFSGGMALGVVLISLHSGYQAELMSFLFGNILAITMSDIVIIAISSVLILTFFILKRKEMTLISLDSELAHASGVNTDLYQTLMYVLLALVVVLGIKVAGIVLVSALLTIPVSGARMVTNSFHSLILASIAVSLLSVVVGIVISFLLNLPMGPTIVLSSVIIFAILFIIRRIM